MGKLLLDLLLAVAVWAAAYFAMRYWQRHRPPWAPGAAFEGFAGALLLLAIAQWLGALWVAGDFLRQLPLYRDSLDAPQAHVAAIAEAVGHLALLAFVLWAAILMTRKSRLFPALLRIELVLLAALPVHHLFLGTSGAGSYVTEPKLWLAVALRLAVIGLFAAVCFVYSLRSTRVRDTFVR